MGWYKSIGGLLPALLYLDIIGKKFKHMKYNT